jgi:hypothetical protein
VWKEWKGGRGRKDRSCNRKPRQAQILKPLEAGDGDDVWEYQEAGPTVFVYSAASRETKLHRLLFWGFCRGPVAVRVAR